MLHVAIVTRSLMTGGAQQQIVKLSQAFDRERLRMTIFLLINEEARDLLGEVPPDVEVVFSPYSRRSPRVLRWLARELRQRGVDVVHSFLWTADATAALSRRLFGGPPLLTSERGDRGVQAYSVARNRFDRTITFSVAAQAVANSHFGARLLASCGCPGRKIQVIPNGLDLAKIDAEPALDLRSELGLPADSVIVGTVSRLIEYKGIDALLRAMSILLREDDRYRCVLIGDGPQRAELQALVASLGISERVRFLGTQRRPIGLIKGFDVATLSTREESEHCSNSILEYMACRVPAVATGIAGNVELIRSGETGWLVPPDDPEALADGIRRLRSKAVAQQVVSAARAKIERDHELAVTCERFTQAWSSVAATDG